MDIGMLWFDNDPKSDLTNKVNRAVAYYSRKYGEEPNLCFVHPSMIQESRTESGKVTIFSNTTILPHHFWIGVQQKNIPSP
jgi:hypothetical protein